MRAFQCPPGWDPAEPYIEYKLLADLPKVVVFRLTHVYLPYGTYMTERGWRVKSSNYPEVCPPDKILYVWGSDRTKDNDSIQVPPSVWESLLEGLAGYFFPYEKRAFRWRTLEEEFFERVGV